MEESIVIMALFFAIYYVGIGILLYLPLYYTRGIPDSLGVRKRYKETLKTAIKWVIKILSWLI